MEYRIQWLADGVQLPGITEGDRLVRWLDAVALAHGRVIGKITYIFCDDEKILKVNKEFLNHDYYTDIITFGENHGRRLGGDIFISLDTVASNAEMLGQTYERELHRVIAHGLLHLCGIADKGPGEREVMERHEEEALAVLPLFNQQVSID